MKTSRTRLTNLHFLAYQCCSRASLAERLDMKSQELERYFRNKHLNISDKFAREIEQKMNKPLEWMDRENYDLALASDEWRLILAFRSGNARDKVLLSGLASLIKQNPQLS